MWFKQVQLFKLEQMPFTSCPSKLSLSQGWISPSDEEDASLVYDVQEFSLIYLQTEAKLIPTKIIRQKLNEEIKKTQLTQDRKLSSKEKNSLKQEIYRQNKNNITRN